MATQRRGHVRVGDIVVIASATNGELVRKGHHDLLDAVQLVDS